ncbi:snRNA-activating protein complex subunit 5 [Octopus sinensis]|uniref:snRNA-activating protein complex subunit 5 n=1 Tax=Octopus sinensis TaxID=2607531 RepID=A0A6P7T5J0_9MOLL|nr:snRNA-activating protein complex subunit 5 [Octopus sinensis]
MSNAEYLQKQLNMLKWEEKYIKSIIELHEDQLSRLKVEELALKHKIAVEEGCHDEDTSRLKKNEKQAMETDENINSVPLMLETNRFYNSNEEDEDDDDDDDDADEGSNKHYDSLKCFLDQLCQREQNKT